MKLLLCDSGDNSFLKTRLHNYVNKANKQTKQLSPKQFC